MSLDNSLMVINVDDLSPMDAMANVKDIVVTDVLGQTKKITKEKLVLPVAQTTEMAEAIAIAQAAQAGAVAAMEDAEVFSDAAAQSAIDAENAQSAIILGGIAHDAAAPTPATSGKYYFTSAGVIPWITGTPTGSIGQEVLVVYAAPSTYTYTLLAVTANYVLDADAQLVAPQIAFNKRVLADGGTVRSKAFMQRVFDATKDLLTDTELLYIPECGMKVVDNKIAKLYNLVGTNDAVQATAANRPYVGGVIATGEKAKIKHLLGQIGEKSINGDTIAFLSTDDWSMVLNFTVNISRQYQVIYLNGTNTLLVINNLTQFFIQNGAGVHVLDGTFNFECGKSYTLIVNYSNGIVNAKINSVSSATTWASLAIGFSGIGFNNSTFECDANVSYFSVLSRTLSASESQSLHAFLANEFPAIEAVTVGSQRIATSNLEATTFGPVTIPEVQSDATWASAQTIYDARIAAGDSVLQANIAAAMWSKYNYDDAIAAINGKFYNGFCIPIMVAYPIAGWHVGSEAEWAQLSTYLGGDTVSGGKMKAKYGGFDNAFATNESGVSLLAGGLRLSDGTFTNISVFGYSWIAGNKAAYLKNDTITLERYDIAAGRGYPVRIFSDTPYLSTDLYTSDWVTNALGAGNLDIRIPFGCTVESIKVESETGITGLSATLLDYNKANGVSLLTGKTVAANAPINFRVVADQPSGYTDNYVRINGTKAAAGARFKVTVKIKPI